MNYMAIFPMTFGGHEKVFNFSIKLSLLFDAIVRLKMGLVIARSLRCVSFTSAWAVAVIKVKLHALSSSLVLHSIKLKRKAK